MPYIECTMECPDNLREILVAELSEIGFESFQESDTGIKAFINKDQFQEEEVLLIKEKYPLKAFRVAEIADRNWNEIWEASFEPINIDNRCLIRASFHSPNPDIPMEVIIDPRMSFGTGHHETTELMVRMMLEMDLNNKRLLDVGSGTGILSILAAKSGASEVIAIDIDPWAVSNSEENLPLNGIGNEVNIIAGSIDDLADPGNFSTILANINLNVLLDQIPRYRQRLESNGELLMSGYYEHDRQAIRTVCEDHGLTFKDSGSLNNWACELYRLE